MAFDHFRKHFTAITFALDKKKWTETRYGTGRFIDASSPPQWSNGMLKVEKGVLIDFKKHEDNSELIIQMIKDDYRREVKKNIAFNFYILNGDAKYYSTSKTWEKEVWSKKEYRFYYYGITTMRVSQLPKGSYELFCCTSKPESFAPNCDFAVRVFENI